MSTTEFVEKLAEMLRNEPLLQWSPNGEEFEITDLAKFEAEVLTGYFRHNRIESFVRQLNMYGFHKVNRKKNAYIFHHPHFTRDEPENYCLIKRACKNREPVKKENHVGIPAELLSLHLRSESPNLAELLTRLIEFNTQNTFDHRHLKSQLESLSRELSAKKLRIIRPILVSIKEKLAYLEQIRKRVELIDYKSLDLSGDSTPTKQGSLADQQPPFEYKTPKIHSAPVLPRTTCTDSALHESNFLNKFFE